jgi:sterol desaturase/sphingolipid hydroxylase (fatty acid hydroxylase superfamily)
MNTDLQSLSSSQTSISDEQHLSHGKHSASSVKEKKRLFVSNKDETIPLFDNPFLEYFSHIHPATPLVYVPVAGYIVYSVAHMITLGVAVMMFLAGLLVWTLTEYVLHRYVFHYEPQSSLGKKIHFLVHGIHHDYPRDSTRLVMPLLISAPLAGLFYLTFATLGGAWGGVLFAGFIMGYVCYDVIHYATHHLTMRGKIGAFLKTYHMRHHFEDDHHAFGVSSPLWDFVFRSLPLYLRSKSSEQRKEPIEPARH